MSVLLHVAVPNSETFIPFIFCPKKNQERNFGSQYKVPTCGVLLVLGDATSFNDEERGGGGLS